MFSILLLMLLCGVSGVAAQSALPDEKTLQGWVQEMKTASRGPFEQIRWFCNDGSVLPPKAYACKDHGGGVQHGEWTQRVKMLRDEGYYIANIFADIRPEEFLKNSEHPMIVKQMIVEQFLMVADDGWIFRRARYYRGALQAEDEIRNSRLLLLALVEESDWRNRYFALREAVKLFPYEHQNAPISEMRQLSLTLAEQDPGFENLRIKIHVKPELTDAERVRNYAAKTGIPDLSSRYERLAAVIEDVFKPSGVADDIQSLSEHIRDADLSRLLSKAAEELAEQRPARARFETASGLIAELRDRFPDAAGARQKLAILEISLRLEDDLFRSSNELLENLEQSTRRERLSWLNAAASSLYGIGLLSARQSAALAQSFERLDRAQPSLEEYKAELDYAGLVAGWGDRNIRFLFGEAVSQLSVLDPIAYRYIHDRLRGSLLLFYAAVLDSLAADANQRLGLYNSIYGNKVFSGLQALNPGLARGTLRLPAGDEDRENFDRNGIYVLPATTEDLPPVAGIITAGKGNILSHIQLLARNLGIPNVSIDPQLLSQISSRKNQNVVLAVSPQGMVQLVDDGPQWDPIFADENQTPSSNMIIRPDLTKLDLDSRYLIPLQSLRSEDSGRVAGPKAANLGELKFHFPEAVTEGLVIPFGVFRALLDLPLEPSGPSVFDWMQEQYRLIRSLQAEPQKQERAVRLFLQRIRSWILQADPGDEFRERLRSKMAQIFGPDGSYGVFVRSDTNVEDLPGFTGAGLNLTVANVVGFDNVLTAINKVWASPFSERAYQWRQAYMENPEHVYASVLLLKSISADKSGVMLTADVQSGQTGWLTIAVNEGVGGAVSGQTAEELRVNTDTGDIRLMSQATEPLKRVLLKEGGVAKIPASGTSAVLTPEDIAVLIDFADSVHERFPKLLDAQGRVVPADIEFGFFRNRLVLFQIRPFLESLQTRQNLFLNSLDQTLAQNYALTVDLDQIPGE
jgi:hypothetical protein